MLANGDREKLTFRGAAAASLHDCYSPPAKLHTVFTPPTTCYSNRRTSGGNMMAGLSCSTLFWVVLFAAFIAAALGITAILVHLSTRSLPDRRQG
jgi:hypothetical protein